MNRKVLLIAYHFPPAGGSGVRRTFAYARYLSEYGWEPIVLTGRHRAEAVSTKNLGSMLDGVKIYRSAAPYLPSLLSIRGRYPGFLGWPEGRLPWWFTGVPKALSVIRRERPAIIWCTYPIPTALLIGLTVSRMASLPLIADLRDAMTDDKFPLEPARRKIYQWIERRICHAARRVVFTAEGTRQMYRKRFPELPESRWQVLPNGYDEEMFGADALPRKQGDKRVLLHSGLIYPSERDPADFFAAVKQLVEKGYLTADRLEIRLRSPGHPEQFQAMIDALELSSIIRIAPPLDYREALAEMFTVDGLIVLQGASCNHQVPAKVYEYLRAGTPILGLTDPEGDTGRLLKQFGVRQIARLNDAGEISRNLKQFLIDIEGGAHEPPNIESLREFSRQTQAGKLAELLSGVHAD